MLIDYLARYTETERSQHITQNDPRVYGQSYVANTVREKGKAMGIHSGICMGNPIS